MVIGSICYGEFISWPHPMDVNVTTAYDYDGTTLHNSVGGSTYASSPHYGAPSWAVTNPWTNTTTSNQNTYGFAKRYGKKKHSMKFSHMVDTDVFSADQANHPDFLKDLICTHSFIIKLLDSIFHLCGLWTKQALPR